jgi:hypothetical protein
MGFRGAIALQPLAKRDGAEALQRDGLPRLPFAALRRQRRSRITVPCCLCRRGGGRGDLCPGQKPRLPWCQGRPKTRRGLAGAVSLSPRLASFALPVDGLWAARHAGATRKASPWFLSWLFAPRPTETGLCATASGPKSRKKSRGGPCPGHLRSFAA